MGLRKFGVPNSGSCSWDANLEGEGLLGRVTSVDEFCWELLGLEGQGAWQEHGNTVFCVLSTFPHQLLP